MEHLAEDLSVALEESESCGPIATQSAGNWGMRKRTRSDGNLHHMYLHKSTDNNSEESSSDPSELKSDKHKAKLVSFHQSDSDDLSAVVARTLNNKNSLRMKHSINRFFRGVSHSLESDSVNENSPASRPSMRRKRKFKRMSIDETPIPPTGKRKRSQRMDLMDTNGRSLRNITKIKPLHQSIVDKIEKFCQPNNAVVDLDATMETEDDNWEIASESSISWSGGEGNEGDDELTDWAPSMDSSSIDQSPWNEDSREIRAGCRRVHEERPGFSINTGANERVAKFLQDSSKFELRILGAERDKISQLAALYSLDLWFESSGTTLLRKTTVIFLSVSVSGRHILEEFDLDAAAAEPRPTVIETGPSAEALHLVYSEDTTRGPLSVASEKVEKFLRPAYSFAYNKDDDDGDIAESNKDEAESKIDEDDDQREKEATNKGEDAEVEVAESKHPEHKDHAAKFEKAGGKDTHSDHHGAHGEKGDKGYKGHHHHEKGQKGHHDKEDHSKHYDEHGGHKKEHHHDDGYHGDYHKKHGGKKAAKYEEKGEHNKGHTTKGEHNIHKKEEYDKKTEFFEEENEGGESETHGGFKHESDYKKGGHRKGGHKKGGHHEDHYGKKGESEKGGHYKDEKGHNQKGGQDKHHEHESKHGEKEGHATGKKWAYKKGDGDGGHGHGAHSHHTYAVQKPPAANKEYKIKPISTFVLPLEEESEDKEEDEISQSSSVVAKKHELKDFKPSPHDNLALISLPSDSQDIVTQLPQETLTTVSTVERYITQKEGHKHKSNNGEKEGKKRANKKEDVGQDDAYSHNTYAVQEPPRQEEPDAKPTPNKIEPISTFVLPLEEESYDNNKPSQGFEDIKQSLLQNNSSEGDLSDPEDVTELPQEALTTLSTLERYIRQEMQKLKLEHPTTQKPIENNSSEDILTTIKSVNRYIRQETPEETKKVTKRLRLKKRKISNGCEANLQKREILFIPEGSSDSFVIVAAEDDA
ncbi:unnamed protein product [Ceutorhynchus assimilis]|uniref:Uncharacterized protein n=1 Tax=Ceutorhynchus assimilis TaxID=467358 RepID=A0A9N9MGU4_9CUCU|nr:unnamed protein product [Ceutorhynchus assimilis]